ncbi:MAG: sodium:proton antiporter [Acidobacteriota bacterium]|nr:sodium:proton antiporter [Acidobacteriota bacterium]
MRALEILALLIVAASIFSFLNCYLLRLPSSIGMLLGGLAASAAIVVGNRLFPSFALTSEARAFIGQIDFVRFLFGGALSFLLFGGALHLELEDLVRERVPILVLACLGVLLSTAIVGFASYQVFRLLGANVSLSHCLVFGALISPTDPIAVLGILKDLHAPRALEIRIGGESLFNDGFGVVVFALLLAIAEGSGRRVGEGVVSWAGLLFLREVAGGIALGLAGGLITFRAMKKINEPNVEVLLSFGLVVAITLAAEKLHTSAPLACVVAGLFIGNRGRRYAMEEPTRQAIDRVWSFADSVLNSMLFLILGLEAVVLWSLLGRYFSLLLLIPIVLAARWLSVGAGVLLLRRRYPFEPGSLTLLTWGGLRGGISVAMALSLGPFPGRNAVLVGTYGVVLFSVVIQGLTMTPLTRRLLGKKAIVQ